MRRRLTCQALGGDVQMTSNLTLVPVRALAKAWADLARKQTGAGGRTGSSSLKVFLDCDARFKDSIRSAIDFVEYVRDRRSADLRVCVTSVRSHGKARHCIVRFIGVGRFDHVEASARLRLAPYQTTSTSRRAPANSDRGRKSTNRKRHQSAPVSDTSTPPSSSMLTLPASAITLLPSAGRSRTFTRHAR
jgi:hypothetical protein